MRTPSVTRVATAFRSIAQSAHPAIWIALRSETEALAEAQEIDRRLAAGEHLPLAGLVAAVKDNIDVAGLPTTAGARSYSYEPAEDATAVARLRAAGAVVIGKTNLDQFATGLVGTRSPFGAVPNAFSAQHISGGSSSGSAVSVALGQVDFSLGTDTAGSGRVPAALNGIVGVKPTRGLIPTTGVVPACRSLDCVTVFARRLDLARLVAELLSGPDEQDPLTRSTPPAVIRPSVPGDTLPDHDQDGSEGQRRRPGVSRIAVPTAEHLEGLADGWAQRFAVVVDGLRQGGAQIVEVDIAPLLEAATLLYGGAFVAERTAAVGDHLAAHADLIGTDLDPTVAGIINAGRDISAVQVFRDLEKLDRLGQAGRRLFEDVDALLTPTTTWHPTLEEVAADPVGANSRMGRFTNFANLLDLASLAVPAGAVNGLPFGVMFTGPAFSDQQLAHLASRIGADDINLLVVGAHLSGQPLNGDLVRAGGSPVGPVTTTSSYRLYALSTTPPKPGLVRDASGSPVIGEVWRLPAAGFGAFVAALPQPMVIGKVDLDDGSQVSGFLCEPAALESATEITAHGGWISYLNALKGHENP
ncbi:allophanate hydrolase [Kineosporia sp. NBRC 101731]|uniref:allophanate hydrolase n=1 Tax=Kineosporia sp. NBRC 101731 TaxID=3032199 RepID=UPI0024A29BC8|nr:allophanate hydrolase [Kineosporia sp. NBRC 101731]GLY31404.1 allophanate hydrolase [Kineosporia sp. NBRC 101731]